MEKKLKTLKDLENEKKLNGDPDTRIYSWRLKQEAIKWIKAFEEANNMIRGKDYEEGRIKREKLGIEEFWDGDDDCHNSILEWIEYFFGITEEDFKN